MIVDAPVNLVMEQQCSDVVIFNCTADGSPEPNITWIWKPIDGPAIQFTNNITDVRGMKFDVRTFSPSISRVRSALIISNNTCTGYSVACRASNNMGNTVALASGK